MKRILELLLVATWALCFPDSVQAQHTTVSASCVGGVIASSACSGPGVVASATIYFQSFNAARAGASGGQVLGVPYQATVTAGAFSVALPDALAADPNTCYAVTVVDNVTAGVLLGAGLATDGVHVNGGGAYGCVQPTGSTWSFDTYVPPAIPPTIYEPVAGPAGPAGAGYIAGLSSDGAGGIAVSGSVAVGSCSLTGAPAGSVCASGPFQVGETVLQVSSATQNGGVVRAQIRQQNNASLRWTATKIANMDPTYGSPPQQIYMLIGPGDSTGDVTTMPTACQLALGIAPPGTNTSAGAIGVGEIPEGWPCVQVTSDVASLSGDAASSYNTDFPHFLGGTGYTMGTSSSGCVVEDIGNGYFFSNLNLVFYDLGPSYGTLTIYTSNDYDSTWNLQDTIDTNSASLSRAVWSQTVGSPAATFGMRPWRCRL